MKELVEQIQVLYPTMKENKWKLDCVESEIKRRFNEQQEDRMEDGGLVIQKRVRKKYEYAPDFRAYLEDERSLLPRAVKITPSVSKQFPIKSFEIPGEVTVNLSAKRRSALEKSKEEEKMEDLSKELENMEWASLLGLFKVMKMKEKRHKQAYDSFKCQVIDALQEADTLSLIAENVGEFRLKETVDGYDTDRIFSELTHRYAAYAYRAADSGVEIIDLFTHETHASPDATFTLQEERFSYEDGTLTIEGVPLSPEWNEDEIGELPVLKLTKKKQKELAEDGYTIGYGVCPIDSMTFFRRCEISGTKLEELMNEGILLPKELDRYRKVAGETEFVEIIEEVKEMDRRQYFSETMMTRAQNFRERQESTVKIDHYDEYLDGTR